VRIAATVAAILSLTTFLSSCATMFGPGPGVLYTHLKGPIAVTAESNDHGSNGCGEASAIVVFGIVAIGDASIEAAKRQGSMHPERVKVTHIDYEWHEVLGIGRFKVRVYFHDPS
jgi:TRL (tRNA-associated locus)-like protein